MFKQAIIYYPDNEQALAQIHKEIATFRCSATIRYVESLSLNNRQIETLYVSLADDIAAKEHTAKTA